MAGKIFTARLLLFEKKCAWYGCDRVLYWTQEWHTERDEHLSRGLCFDCEKKGGAR